MIRIRTLLLFVLVFAGSAQTADSAPFELDGGYIEAAMFCGCDSIGRQLLRSDFEIGGHGRDTDWYSGFEHQFVTPGIPEELSATLSIYSAPWPHLANPDPIMTAATIRASEFLRSQEFITEAFNWSEVDSAISRGISN